MDKHTLQILEFNKILEMAAVFTVTAPGKEEGGEAVTVVFF